MKAFFVIRKFESAYSLFFFDVGKYGVGRIGFAALRYFRL